MLQSQTTIERISRCPRTRAPKGREEPTLGHSSRGSVGCQEDCLLTHISRRHALRGRRDRSGHRFQSSMKKNGDASIAVIRRHKSRLFCLLRGDAKCREGEGARFCPIVSRRIFEGSIAPTKENGEIARLKIDDGHVDAAVAVEVTSVPEIRSCVCAGISALAETSHFLFQETL